MEKLEKRILNELSTRFQFKPDSHDSLFQNLTTVNSSLIPAKLEMISLYLFSRLVPHLSDLQSSLEQAFQLILSHTIRPDLVKLEASPS